MKYIVIEMKGEEYLLPFSLDITHSDFAKYFVDTSPIISAGFISPFQGECYGDSLSLGICSRPEKDTTLLKEMFYL